ncbi:hypothetical protein [Glycomyces paridis]|uniref:Uncharacterized protein n=1 Tax=Glycomyces paridis TaxID=2126555 RepID=A0A4S8PCV8_9ACTN|nr:hypothetical protein [Glycomyces paridis]THV27032.1 hypothetical protein E9998_16255 [Glycomyces paridis]
MRGRRGDQGGRWPVGLWLALVGVSAGTVASFGLVGWTFATGLYEIEDAGEPVAIDSGTVVFEAQEPPPAPAAGEDLDLEPPAGTGTEPADEPSPIEPQVNEVPETQADPVEERAPIEETAPPKLVPVDEHEPECDRSEDAEDGAEAGEGSSDWYEHWDGDTGWRWDEDWDQDWDADWDQDWEHWDDGDRGEEDRHRDEEPRLVEVTEEPSERAAYDVD